MKSIKQLATCMIFAVFLSGCSDTKTNTSEVVNDNSKGIQSNLET